MVIDSEKLKCLVYKYAGWCETARKAQEEMEAAHREANAAMDEITDYMTEVNAANEKQEEELVRLQKAEAELASIKPEHTCRECRFLQRGEGMTFCMAKGDAPFVGRFESDEACEKFEPSPAELAAEATR